MLSRYIRSWVGYKLHIGSNLPPKDNLQKEDKALLPKCPLFRGSTVIGLQHAAYSGVYEDFMNSCVY